GPLDPHARRIPGAGGNGHRVPPATRHPAEFARHPRRAPARGMDPDGHPPRRGCRDLGPNGYQGRAGQVNHGRRPPAPAVRSAIRAHLLRCHSRIWTLLARLPAWHTPRPFYFQSPGRSGALTFELSGDTSVIVVPASADSAPFALPDPVA